MMRFLLIFFSLSFSLFAGEFSHSSCKLNFLDHKMIDDLEISTLQEFDRALEQNGFVLEHYDGNASNGVKRVRDRMVVGELVGVLNIRVKYNDVSFWDQVDGKKKQIVFAAMRYRIETLVEAENALFDELDTITVTGTDLDVVFTKLLKSLPRCKYTPVEPVVVPTPEVEIPQIIDTNIATPQVENDLSEANLPLPVVPTPAPELNEPGCRCFAGETSDSHLCHNYGVSDTPEFYFIHCKNGKPVFDPQKPGWWLITNQTACDVHSDCCNSYKYNESIPSLNTTTGAFCVKLAKAFGQ